MQLQKLDHTAARMASLHERFYYADDVDALLARIRAAVEAMGDAVEDTRGQAGDDTRIDALGRYAAARAALDALLGQEATDG